jgi:hypothetical protein
LKHNRLDWSVVLSRGRIARTGLFSDYYRRKAQELLAITGATRDPNAVSWLRASAMAYERLAEKSAAQESKSARATAT